ncbi:MAG: hypothetical protein JWR21_4390 [Herminiimonas sp.]|nr:hypothetical protein [Herminiimonas sp.]MDB5856070.1 hypothetical protein [Herminiimonas sp.]
MKSNLNSSGAGSPVRAAMVTAYSAAVTALFVLACGPAQAGPADYVFVPNVVKGEREIDFKMGTQKKTDDPRESAASLGFGYGVTDNWFTEIYAKYKRDGGTNGFDAFEWENKFQLTETGKYPIDIGFITEIERPKDRTEGYEVKFGPLFQTEFGKTQLNANILFQRNYRADASNTMKLQYQWQAKYRLMPVFEFGAQGFGELGNWNRIADRADQSHLLGPAVFGRYSLGNGQAIAYNAAYLIDAGDTKHSNTFRMQVEYEF